MVVWYELCDLERHLCKLDHVSDEESVRFHSEWAEDLLALFHRELLHDFIQNRADLKARSAELNCPPASGELWAVN